jgi:hypothetical protein
MFNFLGWSTNWEWNHSLHTQVVQLLDLTHKY